MLLIMALGMIIIRLLKISFDAQEVWVNIFKDISTVIIIPIILGILQADKNTPANSIEIGYYSIVVFIFLIAYFDCWPIIRKREEAKKFHKSTDESYTKICINSSEVQVVRYDESNKNNDEISVKHYIIEENRSFKKTKNENNITLKNICANKY